MNNEEDMKKGSGLRRRDFVKGTAIGAAGLASAGLLAGCGTEDKQTPSTDDVAGKASFDTPPAPIPASNIKKTITTDVVVVGAGMAGVCAALSAQQSGAKTTVLQKGPIVLTHGQNFGAVGSKLQQKAGTSFDILFAVNDYMIQSGNKPNFQLLKLWAETSGESFDWVDEICTAAGVPGKHIPEQPSLGISATQNHYSTNHNWGTIKAIGVANILAKEAVKAGVDFQYDTPGEQLLKDNSGRVTGVIAKNKAGEYLQFNATKGVVLCTGDYGSNKDMVAKYCPSAAGIHSYYKPAYNTGDGHLMGLWVGADMESTPHPQMVHVHSDYDFAKGDAPGRMAYWMMVNRNGERFMNEEITFTLYGNQLFRQQPGADGYYFQILDADYLDNLTKWKMAAIDDKSMNDAITNGLAFKGDTLEELAQKLNIPADKLKASVTRYNDLCDKANDTDFGKRPECLSAIKRAPFYAFVRISQLTVTLGGLKVNTKMQVLNKDKAVIPGLYAAGNTSGDFFGNDYPMTLNGISLGRAVNFGRQAGLNVAKIG